MANERARDLRRNLPDAERVLWTRLRRRQVDGARFRRQVPVGPYIADFACLGRRLVVEVDGGQHVARAEHDAGRTAWLESQGYTVIRFWNNEVLGNPDGVLDRIRRALGSESPGPAASRSTRSGK